MCSDCTVHGGKSSVADSTVAVAITAAVVAAAGLTYHLFTVIWPLWLIALLAGWAVYLTPREQRSKIWHAIRHRRRHHQAGDQQPHVYQATILVTHDNGQTHQITSLLPGQWDSPEAARAELGRRAAQFALPAGATLHFEATPVNER